MFFCVAWQETAALSIVGLTGIAFVWRAMRRRRFDPARDTHCGCGTGSQRHGGPSVIFRARKGERPQIIVRLK
jgi:hypothetical protein